MFDETFVSRAEVDQRVHEMERTLARLLRSTPNEEQFRVKLTVIADSLVEDATPEDRSWAIDRLNAVLGSAGLPPLDFELTRLP